MSFKLVLTVLINLVFLSQLVQGKNHTSCKRALGTFADRNGKFHIQAPLNT